MNGEWTRKLADQLLWTAPGPVARMTDVGFRAWIEQRAQCEPDPRRAQRIRSLTLVDLRAAALRRGDVIVAKSPRRLRRRQIVRGVRRGCTVVLRPLLTVRRPRAARGW